MIVSKGGILHRSLLTRYLYAPNTHREAVALFYPFKEPTIIMQGMQGGLVLVVMQSKVIMTQYGYKLNP